MKGSSEQVEKVAEGVRCAPNFGSSLRSACPTSEAQLFGLVLKVVSAVLNVSEQLKVGHVLSVLRLLLEMTAQDSGRPPAAAFHTVTNPEQARLLSDPESFRFLEPFVARACSVKAAAAEVGCSLSTMLYRVKTFLGAGLLRVARIEKRAGRPIKHYRSAFDAYFIPFEVTPYAGLEERVREHHRAKEEVIVPAAVKLLRDFGQEGYEFYRHTESGTVWANSAAHGGEISDALRLFLNPHDARLAAAYRGPLGGDFSSELWLTDAEAKALLLKLYELRNDPETRQPSQGTNPYFLSVIFLPLEP